MTDSVAEVRRIRDLARIQRTRLGWGEVAVLAIAWLAMLAAAAVVVQSLIDPAGGGLPTGGPDRILVVLAGVVAYLLGAAAANRIRARHAAASALTAYPRFLLTSLLVVALMMVLRQPFGFSTGGPPKDDLAHALLDRRLAQDVLGAPVGPVAGGAAWLLRRSAMASCQTASGRQRVTLVVREHGDDERLKRRLSKLATRSLTGLGDAAFLYTPARSGSTTFVAAITGRWVVQAGAVGVDLDAGRERALIALVRDAVRRLEAADSTI